MGWIKNCLKGLGVLGGAAIINELHKRFYFKKDGYNRMGRDRNGRDCEGYDENGYDINGRDRQGYDIYGRDSEGRDRGGYDRSGRDRDGFDRNGYDSLGYKRDGKDRVGQTCDYYQTVINEIDNLIVEGKKQLDAHEYRYAISNFRPGLENGVNALLHHRLGNLFQDSLNGDLFKNINRCKDYRIVDEEFAEKLHQARKHCKATHDLAIEKEHNQLFFCYKILQELREILFSETQRQG